MTARILRSPFVEWMYKQEYDKLNCSPEYMDLCMHRARLVYAQSLFLKNLEGFGVTTEVCKRTESNAHMFWCIACLYGEPSDFDLLQNLRLNGCAYNNESESLYMAMHARWQPGDVQEILDGVKPVPVTELTAAKTIQKNWRLVCEQPQYQMCRNRLVRELAMLSF